MSVVNNTLLLAAEEGGYQISRSVRFRSAASAYLNRTPASAGNRKTWTWSGWVKLGSLSGIQVIFAGYSTDPNSLLLYFGNNQLTLGTASGNPNANTVALFRDPSAWYHVVAAWDTTQAVAADRIKIYINGVAQAQTSVTSPSLNYDGFVNASGVAHSLGRSMGATPYYFDGYMTEINFVDGQALTPSDFGEYNDDTGVWQPKAYAGTYGTNGFYLNFSDNASTTTLGDDLSGNGNDWTTNNFSLTAGATYDSMIDTPTPYADGGNGRGNYCVLNPLDKGANSVVASGNLDISSNNGTRQGIKGTFGVSTGKWYFEFTKTTAASASVGVASAATTFAADSNVGSSATSWGYLTTGDKLNNNSSSAYGATWTTNDVIGVAFDMDAGTITFYKNNSSQGQAFSGLSGTVFPMGYNGSATADNFNFGQRPFAYTPPTGFKALNTQNLPASTVVDGGEYFNAVLYTGTGADQNITSVGFQPDFTWIKNRATAYDHYFYDAVRGGFKKLSSNTTEAEATQTDGLSTFLSNGFSLVGNRLNVNASGESHVAWNWKANGAGVSNTDGSITSTVSANPTAGFSIVTYTGNGTDGATIGHGLGVVPKMVIVKIRSQAYRWMVYFQGFTNDLQSLFLDSTAAVSSLVNPAWSTSDTTSSVFGLGNNGDTNESGSTFVAYCFAPVAGYSAFGSYTGNGSADGPFVYTGFRPAFVMVKRTDGSDNWLLYDTSRALSNLTSVYLKPNSSDAESSAVSLGDILSNGFKVRTTDPGLNANGGSYIFMAFAEHPFRNALAR
jgi:hypothetical protein